MASPVDPVVLAMERNREMIDGAVKGHARDFLANVTPEELERKIVMGPVPEPRTVAVCLGQMVWDTVAHGGQIGYLRGFFGSMGWFR